LARNGLAPRIVGATNASRYRSGTRQDQSLIVAANSKAAADSRLRVGAL
jgi:hypothetical protein